MVFGVVIHLGALFILHVYKQTYIDMYLETCKVKEYNNSSLQLSRSIKLNIIF